MVHISGFSVELQHLYKETLELFSGIEITVKHSLVGLDYNDGESAIGSQDIKNDVVKINIHQDYINEYVLSHELLHAYLVGNGYPTHHMLGEESDEVKKLLHVQQSLYNTVIHKVILEEQTNRGFDIQSEVDDQIINLTQFDISERGENYKADPFLLLRIFDFLVLYNSRRDEFEEVFKKKLPREFFYAEALANICNHTTYDNPFRTRKVLVKIFKEFDSILVELNLEPLNLNKWILIGFVPGYNQLQRQVRSTFDVEEYKVEFKDSSRNVDVIRLISKVDGQFSHYCFANYYNNLEELLDLPLQEFYQRHNIKYTLR